MPSGQERTGVGGVGANPYNEANFLSILAFAWVWPLFTKAKNSLGLEGEDIYPVPEEDGAATIANDLEKSFQTLENNARGHETVVSYQTPEEEPLSSRKPKKASKSAPQFQTPSNDKLARVPILRPALFQTFGLQYLLLLIPITVTDCFLKVVQPLMLYLFVKSFSSEDDALTSPSWQYIFASGIVFTTLCITVTTNPSLFYLQRLSTRVRVGLTSLIQRKMLRLKTRYVNEARITSLISKDACLEEKLVTFPYLFIAPIQLIFLTYFLWEEFGWPCFPGILAIFLYMPFQYWYVSKSNEYRTDISKASGNRSSLIGEIINGIHLIKSYAWETVFEKKVNVRRKEEINKIKKRSAFHAFQMSVFLTSSRLIPFLTFISFALWGGPLTPEKVFFATAVYNTATHYMVYLLPGACRNVGEFQASIASIQDFLLLEEKCDGDKYSRRDLSPGEEPFVELRGAEAQWESGGDKKHTQGDGYQFHPKNLTISGPQLVMVVGDTGTGKSSLLQLLLGELSLQKGSCSIGGSLSYSAQQPWIFHDTVKNNILLTRPENPKLYNWAVSTALLNPDFNNLRFHDATRIGDGGSGLSGGQRTRVDYARALYGQSDILLLDDPLSAVDGGVARKLLHGLKNDPVLKDKLIILVTNQLHYLQEADYIVVLEKEKEIGIIRSHGSYAYLKENGDKIFEKANSAGEDVDSLTVEDEQEVVAKQKKLTRDECTGNDVEAQTKGRLGFGIYAKYFAAAERNYQLSWHIAMFLISQVFITFIEYWIVLWTMAGSAGLSPFMEETLNETYIHEDLFLRSTMSVPILSFVVEIPIFTQEIYIWTYAALTGAVFFTNLFKALGFFNYCIKICNNIHRRMVSVLVRGRLSYFSDISSGSLLNYFSKDMDIVDEGIPMTFFNMITIYFQIATVIVLLVLANVYTIPAIVIFMVCLIQLRKFYVTASRDLKRIDGERRGQVYSHFTAAKGLPTIRAAGVESNLIQRFDQAQDTHTAAVFLFTAAKSCFNLWIEGVAILLLALVAFAFPLAQNYLGVNFGGGNVGLAICSAMSFTIWLSLGMIFSAEVENSMIATERVLNFVKKTPTEDYNSNSKPFPNWPTSGQLSFKDFSLCYKPGDGTVLKSIDLEIGSGTSVGIVGRTGAGKSSIYSALLRLTDPGTTTGFITLDGKRLHDLGLQQGRKCFTMVPQQPVIFQGELRFNLDPEGGNYSDKDMMDCLEKIGLVKDINDSIDAGGSNLSVGECQQVSLARALLGLGKSKIFAMDEATANIDQSTDATIQETLRESLRDKTVLTIAHRLETVIDYDKILVLKQGRVVEYDTPANLIQNPDSEFLAIIHKLPTHKANLLLNKIQGREH